MPFLQVSPLVRYYTRIHNSPVLLHCVVASLRGTMLAARHLPGRPISARSKRPSMTKSSKLLLITLCLASAFSPMLLAQQVITEMIGTLNGNLNIAFPNNPCNGQHDTITFTGEVHVVATVDSAQNTVDY